MDPRVLNYARINNISPDEARKKLEKEDEIEEIKIEPGSQGKDLSPESMAILEYAGMISKIGTKNVKIYDSIDGIKFTVDTSIAGSRFSYTKEGDNIVFTGSKCIINITEITNPNLEVSLLQFNNIMIKTARQ